LEGLAAICVAASFFVLGVHFLFPTVLKSSKIRKTHDEEHIVVATIDC